MSTIASGALAIPRVASSAPTGKYVSKSARDPARFERHSPVSGIVGAVVEAIGARHLALSWRAGMHPPSASIAPMHRTQRRKPFCKLTSPRPRNVVGAPGAPGSRGASAGHVGAIGDVGSEHPQRAPAQHRLRSSLALVTRRKTLSRRSSSGASMWPTRYTGAPIRVRDRELDPNLRALG